jgi:hypothetical protein
MRPRHKLSRRALDRRYERYLRKRFTPSEAVGDERFEERKVIFVIPLTPQIHSTNWAQVEKNLDRTLQSLVNQSSSRWLAIVIHTEEPNSEFLNHPQIHFLEAPFPPQRKIDGSSKDQHGKRFFAGAWARKQGLGGSVFFALDADDLVHRDFTQVLLSEHQDGSVMAVGWFLDASTKKLHWKKDFYLSCGSCFGSVFSEEELPKDLNDSGSVYSQIMCGAHGETHERALELGKSVSEISFPFIAYVINHSESMAFKIKGGQRKWSFGQEVCAKDVSPVLVRDFGLPEIDYPPSPLTELPSMRDRNEGALREGFPGD